MLPDQESAENIDFSPISYYPESAVTAAGSPT
jgi:hypothetical protein